MTVNIESKMTSMVSKMSLLFTDETKEDQNIAQEKGDILINFKDEHNGLLLDVKLSELSCGRSISKIESPNGVILGYVKKGYVVEV